MGGLTFETNHFFMKKSILYTILLALLFTPFGATFAQKGYKLTVELDAFQDSVSYLSYYYGKGQYYQDTAIVGKNGTLVFEGEDTLAHGMYSVIISNSKLFDLVLDEQVLGFSIDTADVVKSMKVKGGKENKRFFEYLKFLNVKQKEAATINNDSTMGAPHKREALGKLDDQVRVFIKEFHKKYPKSFSSNFIYSIENPQVPEPPRKSDGSLVDSNFSFNYYKSHYFDNFDFSDQRLLRTNSFHKKIMYYMNKLTVQDADSLIKSLDYILKKSAQNQELFKYALTNFTSKYERSESMGMDAVFVHLGKNYFMKGMADEWFSEKQLNEIADKVTSLDPLLIGKKAPNIVVKDTAQKKFLQLYEIKSKYTIVYIWSPDCGHCKKATPKLKTLYDNYKSQGVEVFGVGNEFENEEWIDFINKHDLNWINGSDGGDFTSNFRTLYDVHSTPQTYLLDENKEILAKKMTIESLENILNYFIEKEQKEKNAIEK